MLSANLGSMVFSRGREGGVAFTTAGTFRKYPPLSGLALHVAVTKKLLGYTSRRKGAWVESQHPRTRLTRLESGPMRFEWAERGRRREVMPYSFHA